MAALIVRHKQLPIARVGRGLAPGVQPEAWPWWLQNWQLAIAGSGAGPGAWSVRGTWPTSVVGEDSGTFPNLLLLNRSFGGYEAGCW